MYFAPSNPASTVESLANVHILSSSGSATSHSKLLTLMLVLNVFPIKWS